MVSGSFVKTFAEASHALPVGMHMDADYPFMTPAILDISANYVTLKGRMGVTGQFRIQRKKSGEEFCIVPQSSTFEIVYGRPPKKFRALPFKDRETSTITPKEAR